MRRFLLVVLIAIIPTSAIANDGDVPINIGQPGFYDRINLDNNDLRHQVIYLGPVLVREVRTGLCRHQLPIDLHVPLGHADNWQQHCHSHQACTQSAYFVRGNWYNNVYLPHYNSNNRYILAQNRHYESNGQHYDSYQDRRYDSHRNHDDNDHGIRRDNGKQKQDYDNNRGKYDKDRHGEKNRNRDRRRN